MCKYCHLRVSRSAKKKRRQTNFIIVWNFEPLCICARLSYSLLSICTFFYYVWWLGLKWIADVFCSLPTDALPGSVPSFHVIFVTKSARHLFNFVVDLVKSSVSKIMGSLQWFAHVSNVSLVKLLDLKNLSPNPTTETHSDHTHSRTHTHTRTHVIVIAHY